MKLNELFSKKPQLPPMMSQEEVMEIHQLLVAIVTGKTPIRFPKLKANESNPVQMIAEVFACVLKHPNGRQVQAVIDDLRSKLEQFSKQQADQEKAMRLIEEGHTPPSQNNSH